MSAKKATRGRPKGSGINDLHNLRQIAALLTADPDLKPTTAIKSLGFTDPSVIRRLRDKFNAVRNQLMTELMNEVATGKSSPALEPANDTASTKRVLAAVAATTSEQPASYRAMALAKPTHHKKSAKPKSSKRSRKSNKSVIANENGPSVTEAQTNQTTKTLRTSQSTASNKKTKPVIESCPTIENWMTTWQNVGLTAMTTTFETQASLAKCALTAPLFGTALKQQLALHALTLSVLAPYIKAN